MTFVSQYHPWEARFKAQFLRSNMTSASLFPVTLRISPLLCHLHVCVRYTVCLSQSLHPALWSCCRLGCFTGCSGNGLSFHRLHRSHDTFPCLSLLVSDVLPHADQSRAGEHVWNHRRDHHACRGHVQSQERNPYWWVFNLFDFLLHWCRLHYSW